MEIKDILFEHNFYSVEVYNHTVLDKFDLKDIVLSYACTVKGIYKPLGKNTNIIKMYEDIKINLTDIRDCREKNDEFIKNFIDFDKVQSFHFFEWGKDEINKAEHKIYERLLINNSKTYKHLPRSFFYEDQADEYNFKNRHFPLQHIDKNDYLKIKDINANYNKNFPVIENWSSYNILNTWTENNHLLICNYFVGALKWIPKERVRRRLLERLLKSTMYPNIIMTCFHLKIFDHYFNSPTIQE